MKKVFIAIIILFALSGCSQESCDDGYIENEKGECTIIEQQTDGPKIILNGDSEMTVEASNESFIDPGATYEDDVDGTGEAMSEGDVIMNSPGRYSILYSYMNSNGVEGEAVRDVTVVDTTPAEVSLIGESTIVVEVFDDFVDLGVNYADVVDGRGSFISSDFVDTNTIGTYVLRYAYTDHSYNTSEELIRTVNVVDTVPPVVEKISDIMHFIGDDIPVIEDYFTAIDGYDGDVLSSINFGLTAINYNVEGVHDLTVKFTDSSGNETSQVITITIEERNLFNLTTEQKEMLLGLVSLFSITPEPIELTEIGVDSVVISNIDDLTGNGYMEDSDIIYGTDFNTVTAPEYIEIATQYNDSLSTLHSYLATILPLLANITEFEKEYTYSGFTFIMTKVNDMQYQISIEGEVMSQNIQFLIVIDEFALSDDYMYSISFSTDIASWHYEIVRDLFGIVSITEVIEFLGDSYGIVYANGFIIEDNLLLGFMFKDEITITRRMYFEFTDLYKGIYYVNDDTGTEKYISLDHNAELVFEYENYQPNIPLLGTEKVRWSLNKFSGIDSISFTDGFFNNEYDVNNGTIVTESNSFIIEAKRYAALLETESGLQEFDSGNWFLRIEGEFDDDFDTFFIFESFMIPLFSYNVEQQILDLHNNKGQITFNGISIMNITKEQILNVNE